MRLCSILLIFVLAETVHSEIITIAGNGTPGFSGDGQQATEAQLNRPTAIYADNLNNIYIVDGNNGSIRKIDPSGMITTIAGSGTEGFSGDGSPATEAQLNRPHGISADSAGNIYIADTRNNRIRKVDAAGIITTIAGDGTASFGGDEGPATAAQLNRPHGIIADGAGNIYVADTNNGRIRKIDPEGIITTVAANLNGPVSVAIDSDNNLYVSERTGERIKKIDPMGTRTTLAGNGMLGFSEDGILATKAKLGGPRGIAIDYEGTVYFVDKENQRIRRISKEGTLVTEAGNGTRGDSGDNGPATSASLNLPWGIFVTLKGSLYIADRENHRIRRVALTIHPPSPDFNNDQQVNFQDFLLFVSHFGTKQNQETYNIQFDLDVNGEIGFTDFLIFAQAFAK